GGLMVTQSSLMHLMRSESGSAVFQCSAENRPSRVSRLTALEASSHRRVQKIQAIAGQFRLALLSDSPLYVSKPASMNRETVQCCLQLFFQYVNVLGFQTIERLITAFST